MRVYQFRHFGSGGQDIKKLALHFFFAGEGEVFFAGDAEVLAAGCVAAGVAAAGVACGVGVPVGVATGG